MTDYSRSNILLPHFEEAEAFLNALGDKDAQFTFQTFDDVELWSDEKQKNIKRQNKDLVRVYHGTFNEHKQTLAAINKRGGGVFVTINETDLKGRKKENILKVKAVFVDLDGSPLQPILDLPEELQPHIIIESSPNKWHAYWLVDNCSLEQFPHVQRALAAKFNGDISVNNIDRVMRLTGFSHNKGESFITRINTMQDDLYPYSVNKLIVGLGLELEQPTHKKQTFTHANSGDFEAVKRAAQGRWPAIFGRIGITLPPDNNHAPCPACGGTDRFRYDDIDGHGTFICNQGGNGILSGDGFALIQHKTGTTSSEVLTMVRGIVMPDFQKKPFEPKQAQPRSSTDEEEIETHRNAPRGNDAMLYGIFGEFGRAAAKDTEVNPYAASFNLMTYLSAAIGRDVFFYVGNDIHHVRIFGLHIGRSSKGQKGGAHSLLNRVIKKLTERDPTLAPRKHTGGLSSREGLAALLHDGYMDGKQEVEPITDKRLFIRESEFANVMHQAARSGNTLSAALRDAWDGIGSQPATKHRGMWSTNPHIAIAAACTPVELITLTTKNDVSNGFLNRFVIFWAERTKLVPFPESTPQHTVEDLAQRLSNIIAFAKGDYCWDKNPSLAVENTRQITLSDEAKKVYGHIYIKVFPKLNDGEKVTALTERKAPYLLRIAALFALSDFSLVIEAHHITAAHEWIKYWHESVKFIFNDEAEEVQNSMTAENAEKILAYLKSKGHNHKATQTELSENVFKKHASSKEISAAISSLLTTTPPQIEVLTGERADGSNGRKPKLYALFKNSQNPCEISEISEITTAPTNNPKFAKCEISEISEISPLNSQTDNSLNSEITLNSQTSQTSQSVRNNENPTASSNFAKFANFADTCEDREVF